MVLCMIKRISTKFLQYTQLLNNQSAKITVGPPSYDGLIKRYFEARKSTSNQTPCIEDLDYDSFPVVYCDGSCNYLERVGGIGIFWAPLDSRNAHLQLTGGNVSSVRAELTAVILALTQAKSFGIDGIVVKTDSSFVAQTANSWLLQWRDNSWKKSDGKPVKNIDDILKLSQLIEGQLKVKVIHIPRNTKYIQHDKCEERWKELKDYERDLCGNYHADRLARKGITQPMMTDSEFENVLLRSEASNE